MEKPSDTLVASVIISELYLELQALHPTWKNFQLGHEPEPCIAISGRGILAPGVVIPNEWWEHESLLETLEVDEPQATADDVLAVDFRGRCPPTNFTAMKALLENGTREQLEREIVPLLLRQLSLVWPHKRPLVPLSPVTKPFGTPIPWGTPDEMVDQLLQEAHDQANLVSEYLADLTPAAAKPRSVAQPRRIRIVDV